MSESEITRKCTLEFIHEDELAKHPLFKQLVEHACHLDFNKFTNMATPLPNKVDLRSKCPPVWDQGNEGSCTANSGGAAFWYQLLQNYPNEAFEPARQFIYYCERKITQDYKHDSATTQDCGASMFEVPLALYTYGVCPDSYFPYTSTKYTDVPSTQCFTVAAQWKDKIIGAKHSFIPMDLDNMKQSLVNNVPFVFGVTLYNSFMSNTVASNGIVPIPNISKEKLCGGHALLCVGFDDTMVANGVTGYFIVRNSWGSSWGDHGYCYIPYDYLLNKQLASGRFAIKFA